MTTTLFWTSTVALSLLALLLLRFLITTALRIAFKSLKIGSVGFLSIKNIEWRNAQGFTLSVASVGWGCAGAGCTKDGGRSWIVLRIHGVKLWIPRDALKRKDVTATPPSTKPMKPSTDQPTRPTLLRFLPNSIRHYFALLASFLHRNIVVPGYIITNRLVILSTGFVSRFALEAKVVIEVEDTVRVEATLRAGGTITTGLGKTDGVVSGWFGVEGLRISEVMKDSTIWSTLPALEMQCLLVLTASAPIKSSLDLAGVFSAAALERRTIDAAVTFPQAKDGIRIRLIELQRLVRAIRDIVGEGSPSSTPKSTSTLPIVNYIRSVSLSLPLIVISAQYHTPLEILAHAGSRPLPRSAAFLLCVNGIEGKLELGGNSNEESCQHREFVGKGRELGMTAALGWKEIEGRVEVDGVENDVIAQSAKAFSLGPSHFNLTSTWLPPSLAHLVSSIVERSSTRLIDSNASIVVLDIVLGKIRAHATYETLDSALRIFSARTKHFRKPSEADAKECASTVAHLPRIVGALTCVGLDIRIQGPSRGESTGPAQSDHFFEAWSPQHSLCVTVPTFSMAWGGEYSERSLVRTDADRRLARKLEKRSSRAPAEAVEATETNGGETPPIQIFPTPPKLSLAGDLDEYTLEYHYRLSLTGNTLNAFILAPNVGSTSTTPFSWIDHKADRLPTDPLRFDILAIGPVEMTTAGRIMGNEDGESKTVLDMGTHRGEVNVLLQLIGIDIWRPHVISCLQDFLLSFASAAASASLESQRRPSSARTPISTTPLVDVLPRDLCVYIAVASTEIRLAGSDANTDVRACRGVSTHSGPFILEYLLQRSLRPITVNFPDRHELELREDIRVEANTVIATDPGLRQALVKITVTDLHVVPVDNAQASTGRTSRRASVVNVADDTANDWELKNRAAIAGSLGRRGSILPARMVTKADGILNLPEIAFRIRVRAVEPTPVSAAVDDVVVAIKTERVSLRIDLFQLYLCLLAVSTVKNLFPSPLKVERPPSLVAKAVRPLPAISVRAEVTDVNCFLTLPNNVQLFAHLRRLRVNSSVVIGQVVEVESFLLAGISPTVPGKWDDILRLRASTIAIRPQAENAGLHKFVISIDAESARLRIPFRYVFSQIVDNAATLVKALKQLSYQLLRGGMDSIIQPHPESAKKVPQIDINFKMFALEFQDDPFETRLNIIWRAGYEEQMARRDRYEAFDAKVEAIRKSEAEEGDSEEEDLNKSANRRAKVNGVHTVGVEEALYDLEAYNSTHWVKRMRNAVAEQGRREEALTRRLYGPRHNSQRPDSLLPVDILPISRSSPLARATLQDVRLSITRPSFAQEKLPDFLHDVGKGLPLDTTFTLLLPFHLSGKMEEARCQIRDYPLPLLHIPPMSAGTGHDHASFELETDFVVAEEVGGEDSIRRVVCEVVPPHATPDGQEPYRIIVPRTAMTVKSYATPVATIRSPFATRIGWGNAIQPSIQSVAKVLESLSKASPDPSERVGFWDKLRLQLHWRIKVIFAGEGPVHFHIKGTRDPYALTGFGAGFSKAWRGNVRVLVGHDNPDREFFQIEAEDYVLGIPNLRDYVDSAATGMARDPNENDDRSTLHSNGADGAPGRSRFRQDAEFVKVCAKFINGVRWGLGAVLERACTNSTCSNPTCRDRKPFHRICRKFDFIPHWLVQTKTALAPRGDDGKIVDSFAGFRSDFIHFSISLTSPLTLPLPSNSNPTPSPDNEGYNSLHFSPQASTHFWAWWKLFDGSMSIPIRQGKLFPSALPPAKKFGKHCATIKYRFSLAPLFISHTYRQDSWAEWARGETTVVGLKGKIARFNVDLHQREQEETVKKLESTVTKTISRKVFYSAEVDCEGVDLRVISALFKEPEKQSVAPEDSELDEDEGPTPSSSRQKFTLADEDLEWIDMDDFVDAIYTIPDDNPSLRVFPFINCPRFTYYRKIDAEKKDDSVENDGSEVLAKTKFGIEPSHTCLMGCAKDTFEVQIDAANARLAELEAEARMPSASSKDGQTAEVTNRIQAIHRIIKRLVQLRDANIPPPTPSTSTFSKTRDSRSASNGTAEAEDQGDDAHLPHLNSTMYQEWEGWANRYMIHNPTIQVNNVTRDVLLKYYYSSRERRGFVYHLSASAIRFIRDIRKEHEKKHRRQFSRRKSTRTGAFRKKSVWEATQQTNRLLDDLVGGGFTAGNESTEEGRRLFGDALDVDPDTAADNLPESFDLQSGHLCMFIKPQIALQSDVDDKSTIILTAFRAQLKVFSVVDLRIPDDPVNAHVLHQTFGTLDGLQAFYPREQNRQGRVGSAFVPLETLVDLRVEPWGFDRVVPRTSAAVRYDKFNRLRLSSTGPAVGSSGKAGLHGSHFSSGTDRVSVECDKFSVSANPDHFAAIFNVVTDLLLYSDPLQESQSKKLEAVVFTHDFSDLDGVTEIVVSLQQRLRTLAELQQQYQVHLDELDEEGRLELFSYRAEFARLQHELNLVMQAITRAQDYNGRSKVGSAGIQFEARALELVWHMLDETDAPFAKFSVGGVEFSWISKQDSSISNRLVIRSLSALNSSPDHVFAEIICKHEESVDHELAKVNVFAAILWNALAPVGGISIVEQFELHLHPIRLQLEHSIGLKIMDYVFSQRRKQRVITASDKNTESKTLAVPLSPTMNRSQESLALSSRPPSTRSSNRSVFGDDDNKSLGSIISSSTSLLGNGARLRRGNSADILTSQHYEVGLDADEMRLRASLNRTFILVDITPTVLCLTYRSEKSDHSPLPDIYNITYNTPSIQYRSKTWSFLDLLDEMKRDVIKSVWKQKMAIISQLLQTAHRTLPLTDARSAAKRSLTATLKSRLTLKPRPRVVSTGDAPSPTSPSPLRLTMDSDQLSRTISAGSTASLGSRDTTPVVMFSSPFPAPELDVAVSPAPVGPAIRTLLRPENLTERAKEALAVSAAAAEDAKSRMLLGRSFHPHY